MVSKLHTHTHTHTHSKRLSFLHRFVFLLAMMFGLGNVQGLKAQNVIINAAATVSPNTQIFADIVVNSCQVDIEFSSWTISGTGAAFFLMLLNQAIRFRLRSPH